MKIEIKNKWFNLRFAAIIVSVFLPFGSCTDGFEKINSDPNAATETELTYDNLGMGSLITQMQHQLFPCITKDKNIDVNNYQKMYGLAGDVYSGHQGASNMFDNNGRNNTTYNMTPEWYGTAYSLGYQNYMTPWYQLSLKREMNPSTFAVGQILKVAGMHRITDMYGPIPYKDFQPASSVPFTSQEGVYDMFFAELDEAVKILTDYLLENPGAKPLEAYDKIYSGDYGKWILFANSLKLRLAMRLYYVDEAKSKLMAESAIAAGVFMTNDDNAMLHVNGSSTVNPLYMICYTYNDTRLGATMESYLKGFEDPRLNIWFEPSEISDKKGFNGVRNGILFNGNEYKVFSKLKVTAGTPIQIMTAAEVYFLRAEAALRGWNAGGQNAKTLYEEGVQTAFNQPLGGSQLKAGDATEYLKGTSEPIIYEDPLYSKHNYYFSGETTVKWSDTDSEDKKLERIITQKWIALFPDGQEAWTEFRRTGCPCVFTVKVNLSGGNIGTYTQIARLPYPSNLESDYPDQYQVALELLEGADIGGTKLWWDNRATKPY